MATRVPNRQKGLIKPAQSTLSSVVKQKPTPNKPDIIETDPYFKCCACGYKYTGKKAQEDNFPYSQSPMFYGNNKRLPICNQCIDKFTDQYTELFNSQDEAIKRMCLHWDVYLSDSLLESSRKTGVNQSRIKMLIRQCNMTQNAGKTYDTYLSEIESDVIKSVAELQELKNDGKTSVTMTSMERWGIGSFNPDDYKSLDEHYKMLKKQNPNCDNNQEIFVKDLCYIKLQQMSAIKDKKTDDFDKLTKLYRDTFKQAGLKTTQEIDSSNDETLGVTLSLISQYTPEEYYKDKKLFNDFDSIGDYFSRFILRPLKNLIAGSTERDVEFSVQDKNGDIDDL